MKTMLLPIFEPETSNLFVTCAPAMEEVSPDTIQADSISTDKTQNLVKGFSTMGYKPEVRTLTSFQDDYGLKTGDDEADAAAEDSAGDEEGLEDVESGSDTMSE